MGWAWDEWTIKQGTERIQRIRSAKSSWWPASGVSQGSITGLVMFSSREHVPFTSLMKIPSWEELLIHWSTVPLPRKLWNGNREILKISKHKCRVLHQRREIHMWQCRLGTDWLESRCSEKDPGSKTNWMS